MHGAFQGGVLHRATRICEHVPRLQRRDDIVCFDCTHLRELLDGDGPAVRLQDAKQHMRPIRAVRDHAQIGERPLRRADLAFLA